MPEVTEQTLAERIVAESRTWIGTKWTHQQRTKGTSSDCGGFFFGVAANVKAGMNLDQDEIYKLSDEMNVSTNYRRRENGEEILKLLKENMDLVPEGEIAPGDVLALIGSDLRNPDVIRHLVIVTDVTPFTTFIIHASEHGVVEHRINSHWRKRVHSCWRLRA